MYRIYVSNNNNKIKINFVSVSKSVGTLCLVRYLQWALILFI